MPPVTFRLQVAQVQTILQSKLDATETTDDLPRDESLAADWRLVVEQNTVAGKNPVSLPVVHCNPICVQFRRAVRRPRIKRSGFALRNLLHHAEHLGAGSLVEAALPL